MAAAITMVVLGLIFVALGLLMVNAKEESIWYSILGIIIGWVLIIVGSIVAVVGVIVGATTYFFG